MVSTGFKATTAPEKPAEKHELHLSRLSSLNVCISRMEDLCCRVEGTPTAERPPTMSDVPLQTFLGEGSDVIEGMSNRLDTVYDKLTSMLFGG